MKCIVENCNNLLTITDPGVRCRQCVLQGRWGGLPCPTLQRDCVQPPVTVEEVRRIVELHDDCDPEEFCTLQEELEDLWAENA